MLLTHKIYKTILGLLLFAPFCLFAPREARVEPSTANASVVDRILDVGNWASKRHKPSEVRSFAIGSLWVAIICSLEYTFQNLLARARNCKYPDISNIAIMSSYFAMLGGLCYGDLRYFLHKLECKAETIISGIQTCTYEECIGILRTCPSEWEIHYKDCAVPFREMTNILKRIRLATQQRMDRLKQLQSTPKKLHQ